ncbi:MAG: hypothetical protein LIP09_05410 [Bacteroidales bacterium]|nr:hypothetical protein [Bacteroidales bacterium]
MTKITADIQYLDFYSKIAYLLNDKGEIIGSFVNSQPEYISVENQDRRVQNHKNGFDVVWDNLGEICAIKRYTKPKNNDNKPALKQLYPCLIGLAAGILITLLCCISHYSNKLDTNQDDNLAKISDLEQKNANLNQAILKLNQEILSKDSIINGLKMNPEEKHKNSILEAACYYKSKLQAMTCDRSIVAITKTWWDSLSKSDKEIARTKCKFDLVLPSYEEFFNIRHPEDFRHLFKISGVNYFSKEQQELLKTIERYPKGKDYRLLVRKMTESKTSFQTLQYYIEEMEARNNDKSLEDDELIF